MKRGLSIAAMIMAALFLITGTSVLLQQHSYMTFLTTAAKSVNYYPAGAIAQLIFIGIPCVIFAALNLRSSEAARLPLFTTIYCSVILIAHTYLESLCNWVQLMIAARQEGPAYLACLNIVTAVFDRTVIFANAALVFLLIVSSSCLFTPTPIDRQEQEENA